LRTPRTSRTKLVALLAAGSLAAVAGPVLAAGPASAASGSSSAHAVTSGYRYTTQDWYKTTTVNFSSLTAAPKEQSARAAAVERAIARRTINRSLSRHPKANSPDQTAGFSPPVVTPTTVDNAHPGTGVLQTWQGLNAYTETQAEGSTFTPPDQGLCAGNGYVFEMINDAAQIYDAGGAAVSPPVGSNAFFGQPPLYNPKTKRYGPEPTDPTCTYDSALGRWFVDEVLISLNPKTGANELTNKATLAVSETRNPLGKWNIYQLNITDTNAGGVHKNCPCLGDFPKIATDAYGLFLSTNEYPWVGAGYYGNGYNGAQLYASSKTAFAAGAASVPAVHYSDTAVNYDGRVVPGFTLWPAAVPGTDYATGSGGTEYFVSSAAGEEANPKSFTGYADAIGFYRLSNTSSLDTSHPALKLQGRLIPSEVYGEAPYAAQKPGPVPLRDCLATECIQGFGPSNEQEGSLDPSDTRPLTVWYANGLVTMALDTVMQVSGNLQAGPAWFVINPDGYPAKASIVRQGYIGVSGNNVIYPSVATTPAGTGVMDFTVSGHTYYPFQGYLDWSSAGPASGPISYTSPGVGPLDDFCQYNFFNCAGTQTPTARPRFGDYSWASYMNGGIYIANEVVSSRCDYAQFKRDPTCGGTRSPYSNWSTRISEVTP
jgi:hypothetical protein